MSELQNILDRFQAEVPEFVSTDLVDVDSGLSIGGATADPSFDASIASASFAEVVKSNSRALDLLGLGAQSSEDILITAEKVYILIRLLGSDYCHLLAISRQGNLGLGRVLMKKYAGELLRAVGDFGGAVPAPPESDG